MAVVLQPWQILVAALPMFLPRLIWAVVRTLFATRADLVAENLAFRQQLIVLHRKTKRPRLKTKDRVFWLPLARSWDGWRESLLIVKPATVVRWHRQGFKYYWTWKSQHKGGRPAVAPEGREFSNRAKHMGIKEVKTAPRSPWQNPFVERLVGTLRRDCLDHVVVLNEQHLRRLVRLYLAYYHGFRTHLALGKDTPGPRPVEPPDQGKIVEFPMVGGLHHRYSRRVA